MWRHTVYLGVYEVQELYGRLQQEFDDDGEAYEEAPRSLSACAALLLDDRGRVIQGTPVLSSALWAVGQLGRGDFTRDALLYGFDQALRSWPEAVDNYDGDRRRETDLDAPPSHDAESLLHLTAMAQSIAGVHEEAALGTERVLVKSDAVPESDAHDADTDFLNSFYLDGLQEVLLDAQTGPLGKALGQYLTTEASLDVGSRVDVSASLDEVNSRTDICWLPRGRWPSNPEHHLALSQQFAVNLALFGLGERCGLAGVNGPPGTGKTTMLREIVVGNIINRARVLASLERPADAFSGGYHHWTDREGWDRLLPELSPSLTGFEMVVASANNAAVENISVEIPAVSSLSGEWRGSANYLRATAQYVAQRTWKRGGAEENCWGLVAAKLGRKVNRNDFRSAAWFGPKCKRKRGPAQGDVGDTAGLDPWLEALEKGASPRRSWSEARRRFYEVQSKVDALIAERLEASDRIHHEVKLRSEHQQLCQRVTHLEQDLSRAAAAVLEHEPVLKVADEACAQAERRRSRHLAEKPGFWEGLVTLGKAHRDWRGTLAERNTCLEEAERTRSESEEEHFRRLDRKAALDRKLSDASSMLKKLHAQWRETVEQCGVDRDRYGLHYPGPEWVGDRRELHTAWLDRELDAARSELFLAAMELHEDFVANDATRMRKGLRAAFDVMAGLAPKTLEEEKVRAAWQLFFLVVPVVSTTFASMKRMLGNTGPEAIGWLFIDEAGQAAPQVAVNGLWRAQRAVVVGDPLQLEPVVTIPAKMRRDLAKSFGVSPTWIPPQASVQSLTDRVSVFGRTLSQGEEDLWVSAPLRVHRRCGDPMFSLCNQIAYDGMMINGVKGGQNAASPADQRESVAQPSSWLDEKAATPGTHLQANQIRRLEEELRYLVQCGFDMSDIIAISPFRAVAKSLKELGQTKEFHGLKAGTIHTAQGKEARVVFLVLGGAPNRPGAKAWASSRVNLVNVAASRAKEYLYVIGDKSDWAKYPYFAELAQALTQD